MISTTMMNERNVGAKMNDDLYQMEFPEVEEYSGELFYTVDLRDDTESSSDYSLSSSSSAMTMPREENHRCDNDSDHWTKVEEQPPCLHPLESSAARQQRLLAEAVDQSRHAANTVSILPSASSDPKALHLKQYSSSSSSFLAKSPPKFSFRPLKSRHYPIQQV
mmetsp:Transcript_29435/g.80862  ORF Transcript_29435/g.80862 Transcript_29435/m.80862 type:complete len:164 (+) Transcript_29435:145-636(+)